MKIKPRDIRPLREQFYQEQQGLCALCGEPIDPLEAVLDHDHKTGLLRGVLHRGCNAYIGSMENNLARNKISPNRLTKILENFVLYCQDLKPIRHPTHYTPEERAIKTKTRLARRRKQLKNQRAK
jgi:Recombination endonuclease VII